MTSNEKRRLQLGQDFILVYFYFWRPLRLKNIQTTYLTYNRLDLWAVPGEQDGPVSRDLGEWVYFYFGYILAIYEGLTFKILLL